MPYFINNINNTYYFGEHSIDSNVLSGIAEEVNRNTLVSVNFNGTLDNGILHEMYKKYGDKATYTQPTAPVKKTKAKVTPIKTKKVSKKFKPEHKLVNTSESAIYINKKYLS